MAVCIAGTDKTHLLKGYGWADLENGIRVKARETIFRAASASKPIAAMALARMVEEGLINLDASFYDYVSYFPRKSSDFTIRQLASHTAGIRSYRGKEFALNRPYSIKDSLQVFQNDPLLFTPGTAYHYNSFDWVMVSLAMEEASGIPFEDYVKQQVLNPLAMENTFAEIPGEEAALQANFYTKWSGGFRKAASVDNRYKLAGGGFLTTVTDLVKLGRALIEGRLISPAIQAEFLTAQSVKAQSTYYGLGFEVSRDGRGRKYYGHTGSSVGAYSNFYIYPEEEIVVAILINCTDPGVQPILNRAIDSFFEAKDST